MSKKREKVQGLLTMNPAVIYSTDTDERGKGQTTGKDGRSSMDKKEDGPQDLIHFPRSMENRRNDEDRSVEGALEFLVEEFFTKKGPAILDYLPPGSRHFVYIDGVGFVRFH